MLEFDIILPLPSVIMCVLPWYKTQVKCKKSEPRWIKISQNYVWQMIVFNAYYSLCTTYLLFLYFKSYLYLYLFIKAIVPARGEGACANLCFHFFCICICNCICVCWSRQLCWHKGAWVSLAPLCQPTMPGL